MGEAIDDSGTWWLKPVIVSRAFRLDRVQTNKCSFFELYYALTVWSSSFSMYYQWIVIFVFLRQPLAVNDEFLDATFALLWLSVDEHALDSSSDAAHEQNVSHLFGSNEAWHLDHPVQGWV